MLTSPSVPKISLRRKWIWYIVQYRSWRLEHPREQFFEKRVRSPDLAYEKQLALNFICVQAAGDR